MSEACAARAYRSRDPQQTPLYRLVETSFEEVKGVWEERFERRYGFWRGFVDEVVERYLACGRFEAGFAKVFCRTCQDEFLVALSCRRRGFCPSCGSEMEIISVILDPVVIDKILDHVRSKGIEPGRDPPDESRSVTAPS